MNSFSEQSELNSLQNSLQSGKSFTTSMIWLQPNEPCGVVGVKSRWPPKDIAALTIQLTSFAITLLAVFLAPFAIWLGEINQLIVIGFVLGVMAIVFKQLAKQTAIIAAGCRKGSTIQNIDALMRNDTLAHQIHWSIRLLLLILFALPLGLSAAYKAFTGGQTAQMVNTGPGKFGFTAAPGKQRIGDGVSICTDLYLPFWIDPAINRTYCFALFIPDNDTAVVVDGLLPDYATALMSSLGHGQTLSLTATLAATIARTNGPSAAQRSDSSFWDEVNAQFGSTYAEMNRVSGVKMGFWAGMEEDGILSNYSSAIFSTWDTTLNETFESQAIRTELTRGLALATWSIERNNITLVRAALLRVRNPYQDIIWNNRLEIQDIFSQLLPEFDWRNRANWNDPYPGGDLSNPRWYQPVNTIPALSAAILWSRITSLNGAERPIPGRLGVDDEGRNPTAYIIPKELISAQKTVQTLKRSPWLVVLLAIYPLISIGCILYKCMLFQPPIGNDFNTIAMLAAVRKADLDLLDGAGLSGRLSRRVRVSFNKEQDENQELELKRVRMLLG